MADAMDALKGILGDDAGDKIKNVMSSLSSADADNMPSEISGDGSAEYITQMKDMIDRLGSNREDPRTNLLLSLKPFMRDSRRKSIDSAVKLLNLTKLSSVFRQGM